jgi:HEPN domain-containing protein
MRAEDARILLAAGRYAAAFYMCGYAVECALKACIAKQTREYEFPDLKQVRDSYTHDVR